MKARPGERKALALVIGALLAGIAATSHAGIIFVGDGALVGPAPSQLTAGSSPGSTGGFGINEGSVLTIGSLSLGFAPGATGAGRVTGAGSSLTMPSPGFVAIGFNGTASLSVQNAGTVTLPTMNVGDQASGVGTINIDGAGSLFRIAGGPVFLGNFGRGTLNITGGGTFQVDPGAGVQLNIGSATGGQGTVNVVGPASKLVSGAGMIVGNFASGTVMASDGAAIQSAGGMVFIGGGPPATGLIQLERGATMVSSGLQVGFNGQGTLNIKSGSAAAVNGPAGIGVWGGFGSGQGTVNVDGAGSSLTVTAGSLNVGQPASVPPPPGAPIPGARGVLNVTNGGVVTANGINVASAPAPIGASVVNVTGLGSRLVSLGAPFMGGLSVDGAVTIQGGGLAQVNRLDMGNQSNGGSLVVTGGGSRIDSGSTFNVGISRQASATIESGAVVNAQTSVIGSLGGGNGHLIVDGEGSQLNLVTPATPAFNRAFLNVGRTSTGRLDVTNGAKVVLDGAPVPPLPTTAQSTLLIGGGGGALNPGESFANGNGTVNVVGAGSEIRIKNELGSVSVGRTGTGVLNITDGGKVIVEDAINGLSGAARDPGAHATVNITGPGSLLDAGRSFVLGTQIASGNLSVRPVVVVLDGPGGSATVNVSNGGTLKTAEFVYVGETSTLTGGGGTIIGNLENHGTVAPGNSPGVMNVLGNVTLAANGSTEIELGGTAPGAYDQLNALDNPQTAALEGNLFLDGLVELSLFGAFTPQVGDFFDIFTALDISIGSPIYDLAGLGAGLSWASAIVDIAGGREALRLTAVGASVPEPGTLALMMGALFAGVAFRRRKPE